MDGTLTVRDAMDRSYVGVSEGDPVAGAARLLREEGEAAAVVLRGGDPAGLLRAEDVVALVADGRDPEETTVGDAMSEPAACIGADRRLADAVDSIAEGRRHLVVTDEGAVAGLLSVADVVTARDVLPSRVEEGAPVEGAELESEVYGSQGVCEVCGSLSRDLTPENGRLVCADCAGM